MHKQAIVLCLVALGPAAGRASAATGGPAALRAGQTGLTGQVLAQRMVTAINRQSHIEVRGTLHGPGTQTVQYVVRYQAGAREYMQETGGMWSEVQVGGKRLQGLQAISVGKRLYSSTDGRHWLVSARLVPASALDTLSINPAMAPCCVPVRTSTAQVRNLGVRTSRFGRVYALSYIATSANGSIRGTVLIDAGSYLPRRYSEAGNVPAVHGSFLLTFGGSFSINAPRTSRV